MSTSTQNPDSPQSGAIRPGLKRLIRKVIPVPGSDPGEACLEVLVHGDDSDAYLQMRAQAYNMAHRPDAFQQTFFDWLASEGWEFHRQRMLRSAARNLKISDDYEKHSQTYQDIDDISRQCLAVQDLAANPAQREVSRETDRAFRRALQVHNNILKTSRMVK